MNALVWLSALLQLYTPPDGAAPLREYHNVVFKTVNQEEVLLDLYLPADASETYPAVILLNGGAWQYNDRTDYQDFARGLARSRIVGITPEFRPAPPDGFMGQIADVKDAIRWVRAYGAEYGIDTEWLGIYGSSSGGHLAALATAAGDGEGLGDVPGAESTAVQSAFFLYGIYDFVGSPIIDIARIFSATTPLGIPLEELPRFSPIYYVNGNEPPIFMMHGSRDRLVPLSEAGRFRDALENAAVPVTMQVVQDEGHGFIKRDPRLRPFIYWSVRTFFIETLGNHQP